MSDRLKVCPKTLKLCPPYCDNYQEYAVDIAKSPSPKFWREIIHLSAQVRQAATLAEELLGEGKGSEYYNLIDAKLGEGVAPNVPEETCYQLRKRRGRE